MPSNRAFLDPNIVQPTKYVVPPTLSKRTISGALAPALYLCAPIPTERVQPCSGASKSGSGIFCYRAQKIFRCRRQEAAFLTLLPRGSGRESVGTGNVT